MSYQSKVDKVRNNILANVQLYSNVLAGRYYLYVFENQCFEMYYGTDNFMHLTGVGTNVSPNQFYQLAKRGRLQSNQLYFNARFPLSVALKKTKNLMNLEKFASEGYFIIKDFVTATATYPYAITNIDQSILIGLKAEEAEEMYIPMSFRIGGNIFDKAEEDKIYEIQHILSKRDKEGLYDTLLYTSHGLQSLNDQIREKVASQLLA